MTRAVRSLALALPAMLALAWAGDARAQNGENAPPFSSTYRRPSVSPYTMLGVGNTGVTANGQVAGFNPIVYQQLVQPRQQQEWSLVQQMQQSRQINQVQRDVQQVRTQGPITQYQQTIRPTGHAATFQNLSHFYTR